MEDVLDVYKRPYDPEASASLLGRDEQATDRRDAITDLGSTRSRGSIRP
jgi:hypothetical protein